MRKVAMFLLVLFLMVSVTPAFAENGLKTWADEKSASDNYGSRAAGVAVGGVEQIVTSPLELFNKDHYQEGTAKGVGESLVAFVGDIGKGLVDIVGALIPGYHGLD